MPKRLRIFARRRRIEAAAHSEPGLQRTPALDSQGPGTSDQRTPMRPEARPRRRWLCRLLVWGTATAALVGVVTFAVGAWLFSRADVSTVGKLDFANSLQIPPVLEPEVGADGDKVFRLNLQQGATELIPGRKTETWGANGSYLGPTLRTSRGDHVTIHVDNALPETTTLHWHGMHLPAAADGNPHQPIARGDTWSPSWRIDQPAATLWYHPHPHGQTADHVYRGVAGLFLLDDPEAATTGLPSDYGVNDIPVILQDKRFDGGSLDASTPLLSNIGQLGDTMLINGTHNPHVQIRDDLVRLRVLNASNGRIYNVGFDDNRAFQLVGTDGGLLARPHSTTRIQVSPGERVEIVAHFTPGERTVLRSYPPDLGLNFVQHRFSGGDDRFDLLELRADDDLREAPPASDRLAADELPDPGAAVTTRRFELNGSSRINSERMDPSRVDAAVAVDTTETWEVSNSSGNPHNFHIHDVQFRIFEYDGRRPPPRLRGPKDTVFLPPGTTARLAVRFSDYTDPSTPYMFHCHVLAHEDNGMMGQFTVVEPEDVADDPIALNLQSAHDHHRHPGPN
jgi:FtsP/CotA-like multicopper oxidase with cupredoxin domain